MLKIFSPLEQFELNNYLQIKFFDNSILTISNFSFFLLLTILIIFFLFKLNNNNIIPNNYSYLIESINATVINLLPNKLIKNNNILGKYYPLLYTLFIFILITNLIGLIPYSFAITAQLIFVIALSLTILTGSIILGLHLHYFKFFNLFVPNNTPLFLLPLIVIIEFISFFARGLSLGIRLSANIIAGHLTLAIIGQLIYTFFYSNLSIIPNIIGILPFSLLIAISLLEVAISFIQTYVFTILTTGFISDSINLHGE